MTDSFLTTASGKLQTEIPKMVAEAKTIDIVTGFATIAGLGFIASALEHVEKVRLLVGMGVDASLLSLSDLENNGISDANGRERRLVELIEQGKLELRFSTDGLLHAKSYIFTYPDGTGTSIIGSNNLTQHGFSINREWATVQEANYVDSLREFEKEWQNATPKASDLIEVLLKKVNARKTFKNPTGYVPAPLTHYEFFMRSLMEIYGEVSGVTRGTVPEGVKVLRYQEDAVMQILSRLSQYNGCILADVVGLGKTYVTCLTLSKLPAEAKVLITVPSGVYETWLEILELFNLSGVTLVTHHSLHKWLDKSSKTPTPKVNFTHVFVDEAHRFRNSETTLYKNLKAFCDVKAGVKTVLITATPLNNNPKELRTLLSLFQPIYGKNALIEDKPLASYLTGLVRRLLRAKNTNNPMVITAETERVGKILREDIIKKIVIRRTRKDITNFYAEDLALNSWTFPEVLPPKNIEYDLSRVKRQYMERIFDLTETTVSKMHFARYRLHEYTDLFEDAHKFLSNLIKVNLVKRLDSSFQAFLLTLERMITTHEKTLANANKGFIAKTTTDFSLEDSSSLEGILQPESFKDFEKFKSDLAEDLQSLRDLYDIWAGAEDVKVQELLNLVSTFDLSKGKLLIFSQFEDTVMYITQTLKAQGYRVLGFSADKTTVRPIINRNFDANSEYPEDEYDILVTTDALAEGVNLHRANKVINYDIPWNPTVVIQRVGRVNRIGTQHDQIHIYNFFPTEGTDAVIKSEKNILSKLKAIFHIFGDDADVLTDTDELDSIETLEWQVHNLIETINMEDTMDSDVDKDSYYMTLLYDFRKSNPSHYDWLQQQPTESFGVSVYDVIQGYYLVSYGGDCKYLKLEKTNFIEMDKFYWLEAIEVDKDALISAKEYDLKKVNKAFDQIKKGLDAKSRNVYIFDAVSFLYSREMSSYLRYSYRGADQDTKDFIKVLREAIELGTVKIDSATDDKLKDLVANNISFDLVRSTLESLYIEGETKDITYICGLV